MTTASFSSHNSKAATSGLASFSGTLQASVSYFGSEIGRFDLNTSMTITEIFAFIRRKLTGVAGMVTITLRNLSEGCTSRHRLMLGTVKTVPSAPVQLTLF